MKQLRYRVEDATLAEILGVSNFTNAESAVLELVKNAYDAGAPELTITFEKDRITLADTGQGMDAQDIETNWMHVGKSDKGYAAVDENGQIRVQAGSKGIGRFALARLGAHVIVRSKKTGHAGIIWKTDWQTSTLDDCPTSRTGTVIEITGLRDRWTERAIESLRSYLSRTYNDDKMTITISGASASRNVNRYFAEPKLGTNCTEIIRFSFDAKKLAIRIEIESDEFDSSVQALVPGMNIARASESLSAQGELAHLRDDDTSEQEFANLLRSVGPFEAELYFRLSNVTETLARTYRYKHTKLADPYRAGVILYRNAFSISSYEGSEDWIGLDRRYRKSPAGPAHDKGSWRVRSNQLAGYVEIDKEANPRLQDLANRQGLEETEQYELFIGIIEAALRSFERYRQSIMRAIDAQNKMLQKANDTPSPISRAIASGKMKNRDVDDATFKELRKELRDRAEQEKRQRREVKQLEESYRYDARILNVLATSGLKAASIAHQLKNDATNIMNNSRYIREALVEAGLWDAVSSDEATRISAKSIPYQLEEGERIDRKFISFISSMLGDIEKSRFEQSGCDLNVALERIADRWRADYNRANIVLHFDRGIVLDMPEDAIQVIFDNLILNSLQQNPHSAPIDIDISVTEKDGFARIDYHDNGGGLHERYRKTPMRILDVHETTRNDGHGLGMWIMNNTLRNYGCEVIEILSANGFSIAFTLKGHEFEH